MLTRALLSSATLALAFHAAPATAQQANDIDVLRQQIQQMQARLDQMEALQRSPAPRALVAGTMESPNAFNPGIGVVLDGRAGYSKADPETYELAGFPLGGEAAEGPGVRGLRLGEAEVNMFANVDDLFFGNLTVAAHDEGGETEVGLEEAYVQTLAMPAGLQLTAGKFLSDIGYLNSRHRHEDDFAERPLAYCAILACGFGDVGARIAWTAPADLFLRVGAEVFRGAAFPAAGERHNSTGAHTLFARVGGDKGALSWQTGLAMLHASASERETGDGPDTFTGDTDAGIAQLVLKWTLPGERSLAWQTEYLHARIDGTFNDIAADRTDDGWYSQLVYRFAPQWATGYRYDRVGAGGVSPDLADTALDAQGHKPTRHTVMAQWAHTEFSRLRLQYAWDRSRATQRDHIVQLQYTVTFGAHPAHEF